jgi:sugar phosphate isomerase/epimerase
MERQLSYYYNWSSLSNEDFYKTVREFVDNGCRRFVITQGLLKEMIQSEEKIKFLRQLCADMEVEFSSVHAPFGIGYDLNYTHLEKRPAMFALHKRAMEIAASFGCRTYAIHVGAGEYCYDHVPLEVLRPLAIDGVEQLLPTAEKENIIIAVENSQEPSNTAAEVMKIIAPFNNHPYVGACYDTGHAHMLASAPGKTREQFQPYMATCWWETGVIFEDNALEMMKEQIVTCHIHDNMGLGDQHGMPFDGTINWRELMPKLFSCPRMIDYQTEVVFDSGSNWAGPLLAPAGGYSIRRLAETFRYLGF